MKNEFTKTMGIYQFLRKGGWLIGAASVLLFLAMTVTPPVLASRSNQTVPIPTPPGTSTPVFTSTPTHTPAPATNTPQPPATSTPGPGSTPAPTDKALPPTATSQPVQNTPIPTFSMGLKMSAPGMAYPDDEVEIRFFISHPSSAVANNVRVRNRLPDTLVLISADAEDGGVSFLETEDDGATVVVFAWDTLAAGQSVEATILAIVAPDVPNGSIIDNLGVAYADNAAGSTAGISIGLPPIILPFFD